MTTGTSMDTGESIGAMRTIARGVELSPELKDGIGGTLAFAVLSTLGIDAEERYVWDRIKERARRASRMGRR